jgi:hypothetical protein
LLQREQSPVLGGVMKQPVSRVDVKYLDAISIEMFGNSIKVDPVPDK